MSLTAMGTPESGPTPGRAGTSSSIWVKMFRAVWRAQALSSACSGLVAQSSVGGNQRDPGPACGDGDRVARGVLDAEPGSLGGALPGPFDHLPVGEDERLAGPDGPRCGNGVSLLAAFGNGGVLLYVEGNQDRCREAACLPVLRHPHRVAPVGRAEPHALRLVPVPLDHVASE